MQGKTALFKDRDEAGRCLAAKLEPFRGDDLVVLGLPRGGVPVARRVAETLGAPLDVVIARKVGVPFQPEIGMGAIGEDGVGIVHDAIVRAGRVTGRELDHARLRERVEVDRRVRCYRADRTSLPLAGRTAIVVDDGIATGSTAWTACRVARARGAARVVLATPVAPVRTLTALHDVADAQACVVTVDAIGAVGQWYRDFRHVTDDEVLACLRPTGRPQRNGGAWSTAPRDDEVEIPSGSACLPGRLTVPHDARSVVVFALGSGNARHSPRTRFVAHGLQRAGLATLVCDLLTPGEELDRYNVFDLGLLTRRLADITGWLRTTGPPGLTVSYLGTGTGSAAALWAAGEPGANIAAVVSISGQPGLVRPRLGAVTAPVLLIVPGAEDRGLGRLNREAVAQLRCPSHLTVVREAGDLFEEPRTLERVVIQATGWFLEHPRPTPAPALTTTPTSTPVPAPARQPIG
jgi:putative phosphoribosyl transferase